MVVRSLKNNTVFLMELDRVRNEAVLLSLHVFLTLKLKKQLSLIEVGRG